MIVNEIETKFFAQSKAMVKFLGDTKGLVWDHQAEATKCIREHFNDATKPRIALCVLPTGSGKSGIAVLSAYACGAERVLIITPSKHISKQMYDSFYDDKGQSFLVKRSVVTLDNFIKKVRPSCVGIIKDTININSYFNHELIVANAQKFGTKSRVSIRDIPNDAVDFVIVDEAHHYPAETWRAIVDHFPCNKLFLTATPRTGKNEDILVNQSESICYQVSREVLVDRGIIRPVEFKEDSESLNYLTACRVCFFLIYFMQ